MTDFNDADDLDFDRTARRAGAGLGAISAAGPAMAKVKRRASRRRALLASGLASALVVGAVAVASAARQDKKGPSINVAAPSSTSTTIEPTTSTDRGVTTTMPADFTTTTATGEATTATTVGQATTTTGAVGDATTTTAPGGSSTTLPAQSITVDLPTAGTLVPTSGPLVVRGMAKTFESVVNIKLYDDQHHLILETKTLAMAPNVEPGPYSIVIHFPQPVTAPTGTLEVFEYSAKDGAEVNKVTVQIVFVSA